MKMPPERKDCYECEHCVYLGEGGYMRALTNDIVIEDLATRRRILPLRRKKF